MTTVLVWNVDGKPLHDLVANLVVEHAVDILILIECETGSRQKLLSRLRSKGPFQAVPSSEAFGVFTRFNRQFMQIVELPERERRMNFWRLHLPLHYEVLLAVVHGWDKRSVTDSETRRMLLHRVAQHVDRIERTMGHCRSLVAGDFNANPFESEMASVEGLHAIPMRSVSGRTDRSVEKRTFPFFYHPMWRCYGSAGAPPATYFRYKYQAHELFWHMIDGVVVRPDLLDFFREEDLCILGKAGKVNLLKNGLPNREKASDHLPVLFRLQLKTEVVSDEPKPLA